MTEQRLAELWKTYRTTRDPLLARRIAVWDAIYADKEARNAPLED